MSRRLAVMVTTGILGGGLFGFYVQDQVAQKYGVKKPQLDGPLQDRLRSQQQQQLLLLQTGVTGGASENGRAGWGGGGGGVEAEARGTSHGNSKEAYR